MNIFENYLSKINEIISYNKKSLKLTTLNNLNNINLDNDKDINSLFYLGSLPDPDLLIRTGGYLSLIHISEPTRR